LGFVAVNIRSSSAGMRAIGKGFQQCGYAPPQIFFPYPLSPNCPSTPHPYRPPSPSPHMFISINHPSVPIACSRSPFSSHLSCVFFYIRQMQITSPILHVLRLRPHVHPTNHIARVADTCLSAPRLGIPVARVHRAQEIPRARVHRAQEFPCARVHRAQEFPCARVHSAPLTRVPGCAGAPRSRVSACVCTVHIPFPDVHHLTVLQS
jgi:hypothetical protein